MSISAEDRLEGHGGRVTDPDPEVLTTLVEIPQTCSLKFLRVARRK